MSQTKGNTCLTSLSLGLRSLKQGPSSQLDGAVPLSRQIIRQAYEKSNIMASKIKQLRTILGYDAKNDKKLVQTVLSQKKDARRQQKGTSLKKFVLSMRKRTDKYYQTIDAPLTNTFKPAVDQKAKAVSQYTAATLKFVHSFLPHQTLMEHELKRRKLTLDPLNKKLSAPQPQPLYLPANALRRSITHRQEQDRSFTLASSNLQQSPAGKKLEELPESPSNQVQSTISRQKGSKVSFYLPSCAPQITKQPKERSYEDSKTLLHPRQSFHSRATDLSYRPKHRVNYQLTATTHPIEASPPKTNSPLRSNLSSQLSSEILIKKII